MGKKFKIAHNVPAMLQCRATFKKFKNNARHWGERAFEAQANQHGGVSGPKARDALLLSLVNFRAARRVPDPALSKAELMDALNPATPMKE